MQRVVTLKFPVGVMAGSKSISYIRDGLIAFNTFGGMLDHLFQVVLKEAKLEFAHSLYHEWRLYTSCTLFNMLCLRKVRDKSNALTYVEFGAGEGHTLWFCLNYANSFPNHRALIDNSKFIIYDSFKGIDPSLPSDIVLADTKKGPYLGCNIDRFKERFNGVRNLILREGYLPGSLDVHPQVKGVDFLHIDTNSEIADAAAMRQSIENVNSGGIVLIDDYGFPQFRSTFDAINKLCDEICLPRPCTLPTGQGLLLI